MFNCHLNSIKNVALCFILAIFSSLLIAQPNQPPGKSAELLFSHELIDFGAVTPNVSVSRTLTIEHTGKAASPSFTILSAVLDELDSSRYSTDFSGPVTLLPGQQLQINVTFTPPQSGIAPGTLVITHTAAQAVTRVELTGVGNGPSTAFLAVDSGAEGAGFFKSFLSGFPSIKPTQLQFGPDQSLYVATVDGGVYRMTVERNGINQYSITAIETIDLIRNMVNHDDDGSISATQGSRLVTGMLVAGTALQPMVYVTSSDPRVGGGPGGTSTNLDTNSSIVSRLSLQNGNWLKQDLVRGLPRSEENHHTNGIALNAADDLLYVAVGGNTNQGAPSNNFAFLPEYALSAAILEIDLAVIGNGTYDLPTLDDEDRPGSIDANDPFGGNGGKNQAIVVADGPVQVYAPGFRNPYDVIIMDNGNMYTWDNGPNAGWGGVPIGDGGQCTNAVVEPGATRYDALHRISGQGYYGGHPNPTRGNNENKFNTTNPQSPVPFSNTVECIHRGAPGGVNRPAHPDNTYMLALAQSTNGLTEYRGSNFSGALQGELLAAVWDNSLHRVEFSADGASVVDSGPLFSNIDIRPLDVTAQGDLDLFPGTIWVADFVARSIAVFEPDDYDGGGGTGCNATDPQLDADQDGYSNADEYANGTNPCSAADVPADADQDFVSDRLDDDDDNDGLLDVQDPFAVDVANGSLTDIPVNLEWSSDSPAAGYLENLGFTGLMVNGSDDYLDMFDTNQMTIGGAAGVLTVDNVPSGDAIVGTNTQQYAFQLGVNVNQQSPVFEIHSRIVAPFAGISPQPHQSVGVFFGNGDQDNYIKLVANAQGSTGGIQFMIEVDGVFSGSTQQDAMVYGAESIDLTIQVSPDTQTAKAFYRINSNAQIGELIEIAQARDFPVAWLNGATKPAAGIISTSFNAVPFTASWDNFSVDNGNVIISNSAPVASIVANSYATVQQPQTLQGEASDDGLPEGSTLQYQWSQLSGPSSVTFSDNTSAATQVSYQSAGVYEIQLLVSDGELQSTATLAINVNDPTNSPDNIALRINAGGIEIPDSVETWQSGAAYVNTGITFGNNIFIDMSAVPDYIPAALFSTERWDPGTEPEMHWMLPVTPGAYEVRLYFSELFPSTQGAGLRVFDVDVEDQSIVGIDVWSEVGANAALMKTIEVDSDDVLDIVLRHVTQNPSIKGIEVIAIGSTEPPNSAPVVEAGQDTIARRGRRIRLNGSVTDDGLPEGSVVQSQWRVVGGPGIPGSVEFTATSALDSRVRFSESGRYILELISTDGELSGTDTMEVEVCRRLRGCTF